MTPTVIPTGQEHTLEGDATKRLMDVLTIYKKNLAGVLPKELTFQRWAWLCINSIRMNPALCQVKAPSFINAVMLASNMGLEIRRNSCYLVPFGEECQLLIDYRGKMELARRAGVGAIKLGLVREGDEFDCYEDEQGPHFRHREASVMGKEGGEIKLAYMAAALPQGGRQIEIMTLAQIEAIRKRSKSGAAKPVIHYKKELPGLTLADIRKLDWESLPFRHPYRTPWVTDYEQMARKTAMHRGSNYIPQSSQLALSQEVDESTLGDKKMPIAPELAEFMDIVDPAHNRPLVETQGDVPEYAKLPDAVEQVVGYKAKCGDKTFVVIDAGEEGHRWEACK